MSVINQFARMNQQNLKFKAQELLNEAAYFGKTPEVLRIEKCCNELIEAYKKNQIITTKEFNEAVRNLELEIASFVNAESVFLEIDGTFATCSSWMKLEDHVVYQVFNNDRLTTTTKGVKFTDKRGKSLFIMISPIHLTMINGEELCAILLHEIGHNLDIQYLKAATVGSVLFFSPIALLQSAIIISLMHMAGRMVNSSMGVKRFVGVVSYLLALPATLIGILKQLMAKVLPEAIESLSKLLPKLAIYGTKNPVLLAYIIFANSISGYDGEKFSDAYATSFGYGDALRTGLNKLTFDDVSKTLNHIPLFRYYQLVNDFSSSIISLLFAPHPSNINRVMNNITYLKKAAEEVNNPRLKKEIEEDIKELEDAVVAITKDDYEPIFKKMHAEGALKSGFKSSDIRELITQYRNWDNGALK